MNQPDPGTAGFDVGLAASLDVNLGRVADQLENQSARAGTLGQSVIFINHIPAPTANASGIIKAGDVLGPRTGQAWDIRRMTASNFSAGTVSVYLNSHQPPQNQLVAFTTAGTYTFGGKQLMLLAGDQLVVNTSGVTGQVFFSIGVIQIAEPWLADYLL